MSAEKKAGSFDALLEEIGVDLNKALPAEGEGAEGAQGGAAGAAEGGEDEDEDKEDGEGAGMAKSFEITLENGEKIQAVHVISDPRKLSFLSSQLA